MSTPTSAGPSDSAMHGSTTIDPGEVPPDVAHSRQEKAEREEQSRKAHEELLLARKEQAYVNNKRTNFELLHMLERRAIPTASKSAKGIGFYTHVGGVTKAPRFPHERYVQADPVFLPIGGPKRITRKGKRTSELDANVARLWGDFQALFQKEEDRLKETKMNLADLAKRYVPLEKPKQQTAPLQRGSPVEQQRLWQRSLSLQKDIVPPERRHSTGILESNSLERRHSENVGCTQKSRNESTTTNAYEPSRDPRLHRR